MVAEILFDGEDECLVVLSTPNNFYDSAILLQFTFMGFAVRSMWLHALHY